VCRAGATTLAELTKAGVPSVLVPYPFAAADHQRLNAQTMVEPGAALLVADDEIGTGLLPTVRKLLADSGRLQAMAAHAKSLGKPDATQRIARSILNLAGEGHDGAA
jgi:UDP-N-acetylglucosamine--N-acetylmuramyl-(pentapeptide) pyrophosphoryl-undecaprenol N-acetylglucosamine transferase